MILEIIQYYWPRLLLGVWFAFANTAITVQKGDKKHLLRKFVIMFFISCTTVAVFAEYLARFLFNSFISDYTDLLPQDIRVITDILSKTAVEAALFALATFIFSKLINEWCSYSRRDRA